MSTMFYTVPKAFYGVGQLPVIFGNITSNIWKFLDRLDYQYLLGQLPVHTGSSSTSVFPVSTGTSSTFLEQGCGSCSKFLWVTSLIYLSCIVHNSDLLRCLTVTDSNNC